MKALCMCACERIRSLPTQQLLTYSRASTFQFFCTHALFTTGREAVCSPAEVTSSCHARPWSTAHVNASDGLGVGHPRPLHAEAVGPIVGWKKTNAKKWSSARAPAWSHTHAPIYASAIAPSHKPLWPIARKIEVRKERCARAHCLADRG